MKPTPTPASIPGLVRAGTPLHWRDEETPYVCVFPYCATVHDARGVPTIVAAPASWPCLGVDDDASNFTLRWDDATAHLHACLWLRSQGHPSDHLLPASLGFGGTVPAHAGLTDLEVSALLLSASVVSVSRGGRPVESLLGPWVEQLPGHKCRLVLSCRNRRSGGSTKWHADAGRAAADAAALADGCALLDPGWVRVPTLEQLGVTRD